jgi:hypothetical protein
MRTFFRRQPARPHPLERGWKPHFHVLGRFPAPTLWSHHVGRESLEILGGRQVAGTKVQCPWPICEESCAAARPCGKRRWRAASSSASEKSAASSGRGRVTPSTRRASLTSTSP